MRKTRIIPAKAGKKAGKVQVIKCYPGLPWSDAGVRRCDCCSRSIEEGGVEEGRNIYCDETHQLIASRYRLLCEQAIAAAQKYPHPDPVRGHNIQIDYSDADNYLAAELAELKPIRGLSSEPK
ncbi:MAG TPA: hypothetical protein VF974_00350 [Patescibacteria group bacterium]